MIRKVKDAQCKFLLVTVPATSTYQVLYMVIPEINQVQFMARQGKRSKSGNYYKDQWEAIDWGSRTTIDALPKKYTVEIAIDELTLEQVKQFCPAVCDIQYSTKMLEDMKIRSRER